MTEQRNTLQGRQDTGMQLVFHTHFLVQGNSKLVRSMFHENTTFS